MATSDALMEVRLTAIRYAARDINLYEFQRLDGTSLPACAAGAHIDLHLPNGLVRNYSLIEARPDLATYTLGIKRDAASRGGSRLIHDELRVGKTIKISAPRNNFPLKEDAAHTILLAGGIGIVPIWCMVQRLEQLGRPWQLFYSCRSRPDMAFARELEKRPAAQLHFDDQNGGRVLDIARVMAQASKEAHLYCCGPTPMMQAFEAAVAQWPRARVHVEYFAAKEQEPVRLGGFTVELARSGKEFFIPEGQTILDILLDDGIDLESSCENGICGSCEQQVIAGVPLHCDSILSEEERAENKRVMICCAGCKTERLVLDL